MSRSYKKNLYRWRCNGRVMKKWKNQNNRSIRTNKDEEMPSGSYYKKLKDPWSSPADGKLIGDNESEKKWKNFGK